MEKINRTQFHVAQFRGFPLLVTIKNNWRQRNVEVRQHPHDEGKVVTRGIAFDGSLDLIVEEDKADYRREIQQGGYVETQ